MAPTYFVRDLLSSAGWDPSRIDVLYHFQRLGPERVPAPADAPILYFGRLAPEKGVADLLRAMQRLPNVRLRIAGDGPQRAELQQRAYQLNLTNVNFVGELHGPALEEAIAATRFTVFPSLSYEVLGKTILESYAQSRAVIASDLGSRRELVFHGKTGQLYPPGDYSALAFQIDYLSSHPETAEAMGKAGRKLVQNRHSPEDHVARLTRIYEQMVAQRGSGLVSGSGSRRVKVAFIGGRGVISKYSGIEAYYEAVGKLLAQAGHEVTIYCRSHFTPSTPEYFGIRLVCLPTIRTKHLETLVHTLLSTIHACFSDYDIVHYHALGPALFSFIPRLAGKKTIVSVQGLDWKRKKWGYLAAQTLKLGELAASSFPDATIVVSRVLAKHYATKDGGNVIYIPNGTELRSPHPVHYLPEWQLVPSKYILFLGRFSPEKNCDLLVRAYQRLRTDVKLVLAGGSSYSNSYTHELHSCASENIRVLEWISGAALEELLSNAMIFVLPSDIEGLSLALLDAMGAGLCVVTSDVPENRELVEGVGFTFPVGNELALSQTMHALIENPELRARSGAAAQQRAREQYLWTDIARRTEREYLRLLGEPPKIAKSLGRAA